MEVKAPTTSAPPDSRLYDASKYSKLDSEDSVDGRSPSKALLDRSMPVTPTSLPKLDGTLPLSALKLKSKSLRQSGTSYLRSLLMSVKKCEHAAFILVAYPETAVRPPMELGMLPEILLPLRSRDLIPPPIRNQTTMHMTMLVCMVMRGL